MGHWASLPRSETTRVIRSSAASGEKGCPKSGNRVRSRACGSAPSRHRRWRRRPTCRSLMPQGRKAQLNFPSEVHHLLRSFCLHRPQHAGRHRRSRLFVRLQPCADDFWGEIELPELLHNKWWTSSAFSLLWTEDDLPPQQPFTVLVVCNKQCTDYTNGHLT